MFEIILMTFEKHILEKREKEIHLLQITDTMMFSSSVL